MSKIDEVRADMVKAMKAGDKESKETLSMLLAALKNKAIDKRSDLTAEEETQVILKEIKQTKETLEKDILAGDLYNLACGLDLYDNSDYVKMPFRRETSM